MDLRDEKEREQVLGDLADIAWWIKGYVIGKGDSGSVGELGMGHVRSLNEVMTFVREQTAVETRYVCQECGADVPATQVFQGDAENRAGLRMKLWHYRGQIGLPEPARCGPVHEEA